MPVLARLGSLQRQNVDVVSSKTMTPACSVANLGQRPRRPFAACAAAGSGAPSPTSSVDLAGGSPPVIPGTSGGNGRGVAASSSTHSATAVTSANGSGAEASADASSSGAAAPKRPGHGGRDASLLSMEEQERELLLVTKELPRAEARLEALALWVGAAVAFGGGVWYIQGAEKAQEFFAG
jgi:hypothetical protein